MSSPEHESSIDRFFAIVDDVKIDSEQVIVSELAQSSDIKRVVRLFITNPNLEPAAAQETREAIVQRIANDFSIEPAVSDRAISMCEWMIDYERGGVNGEA